MFYSLSRSGFSTVSNREFLQVPKLIPILYASVLIQ